MKPLDGLKFYRQNKGAKMTREEIEQAIKNGESVWIIRKNIAGNKKVGTKMLNKYDKVSNNKLNGSWNLNKIFKTQAEAEHYLHHANISRSEYLPFLTWEEFDKGYTRIKFKSKNGDCCSLEGYFDKDTNYGFIDVVRNWHCVFSKDYTEADFYKAYDECVRLFKGKVGE